VVRSARWLLVSLFASVLVSPIAVGGCNGVLGIEERTFDPDAGQSQQAVSCDEYCDLVTTNCTGEFSVYASRDTCLGSCALMPLGERGDSSGNTVACRLEQALAAGETGELSDHCPIAGPGGRGFCGDDCEFYCANLPVLCEGTVEIPVELTGAQCLTTCKDLDALDDDQTYSVEHDDNESSRDCRILHLTNATAAKVPHCQHTIGGAGPCAP
jgi:hypothetical protein